MALGLDLGLDPGAEVGPLAMGRPGRGRRRARRLVCRGCRRICCGPRGRGRGRRPCPGGWWRRYRRWRRPVRLWRWRRRRRRLRLDFLAARLKVGLRRFRVTHLLIREYLIRVSPTGRSYGRAGCSPSSQSHPCSKSAKKLKSNRTITVFARRETSNILPSVAVMDTSL